MRNETTRANYSDRGMGPFAPSEKQILKSYYEVSEEIVEDQEELASWAREAAGAEERGRRNLEVTICDLREPASSHNEMISL